MVYLRATLYIASILALLALTALLLRANWLIEESRLLVVDARSSVSTWNNYSTLLTKQLASEKNQKAIDAGIAVAASLQGSIRLVNTQVVPRTMKLLDATERTTLTLNTLVANTDRRLTADDGLLPESTRVLASVRTTADAFQVDAKALSGELLKITQQGQVSMENINAVLASPEWVAILKNVEGSTRNIEATTAELPKTAASIEKILATAEKWQKPMLLAGMLATIARAFIP